MSILHEAKIYILKHSTQLINSCPTPTYILLCTSNPALMAHKAIKLNGSSQNTQYFLWCIIYSERQREKERERDCEKERERNVGGECE